MRFVECEYKAMLAFAKDLAILIKFLREETKDQNADHTARQKVGGWLRKIRGPKFISALLTQIDVDELLKIFSKETQADDSLIIHVPSQRAKLKASLMALQHTLGQQAETRLGELRRGKYSFDRIAGYSGSSENSDDSGSDDDDTLPTRRPSKPGIGRSVAPSARPSAEPTREIDILLQGQEPGQVAEYLLRYQKECVDILIREFDARVANIPLADHLAVVFRFDTILAEIKRGLGDPSNERLLGNVSASIRYLVKHRYKGYSASELYQQWCLVFHWLSDKWELFFDRDLCPANARAKTKAKWKSRPRLLLTGDGSVFEALWLGHGPPEITGFMYMNDDMISIRTNQSDTERIGRSVDPNQARPLTSVAPPIPRARSIARYRAHAASRVTSTDADSPHTRALSIT